MLATGLCRCGCGSRTRLAPYTVRRQGWVKGEPVPYINGHTSKASPVNTPSSDQAEIGWAAGLYEGEGSFSVCLSKGRPEMQLTIAMVDRWPLDRFLEIVGAGKVAGPYGPYQPNCRPQFCYRAHSERRCAQVVNLIWDYLSPRRQEQITRALERR